VFGSVPVRETATQLVTFAMKPFATRQLESVRGGGRDVGEGGGYGLSNGVGGEDGSRGEKGS